MKFKVITALIMTSLFSSSVLSDDSYLIRVYKEGIDPLLPEQIIHGDWVDIGSTYNCGAWSPSLSDFYVDTDVSQSMDCSQDQERIITYRSCSVSGKCTDNNVTDYNTISVTESQVKEGTKLYSLNVSSCGLEDSCYPDSSHRSIKYHDTVAYASRSWQVMVIDSKTNSVDSINKYDVFGDINQAYAMRDKLRAIPNGKLVAINTWDEPSRNVSVFHNELVNYFGANKANSMEYRSSYLLLGYKNGSKLSEKYGGRYGSGVTTGDMLINP